MGTYLSTPNTNKETEFGTDGKELVWGMSGMQGWRRTMEDAHICHVKLNNNDDMCLFGVFDGHGGAEVAKFCAKHMGSELLKLDKFKAGDFAGALKDVFHHMDDLLRDETYAHEIASLRVGDKGPDAPEGGPDGEGDDSAIWQRIAQLKRMVIEQEDGVQVQAGCTAVVALKDGNTLYVANAGDSRGVLSRGGQAVALSTDHKPLQEGEKARILAAGGTVNDVGGVARVNGNLNLSRAIGDLKYKVNTALPPEAQIITAHPDVRMFELTPEDRFFLLACDGIWDVMTNQEAVDYVTNALSKNMQPHEVSAALIDRCLASDPKDAFGIGCDNMTCVIVMLNQQDAATAQELA